MAESVEGLKHQVKMQEWEIKRHETLATLAKGREGGILTGFGLGVAVMGMIFWAYIMLNG